MLSVSQSAAFCRWLSEVLFTTNWKYEMKNIQLKNIKYCARWKMLYIHFTMNQLTTWITLVPLALYASSLILVINPFTSSLTSDRFCNQQIILYNGWHRDVHCTVYSVQCTSRRVISVQMLRCSKMKNNMEKQIFRVPTWKAGIISFRTRKFRSFQHFSSARKNQNSAAEAGLRIRSGPECFPRIRIRPIQKLIFQNQKNALLTTFITENIN